MTDPDRVQEALDYADSAKGTFNIELSDNYRLHPIVSYTVVLAEEVIRLRGEVEAAYQRGLTNGAYSR